MQVVAILKKQRSFLGTIRRTVGIPSCSPLPICCFGSRFCTQAPNPATNLNAESPESEKEEEKEEKDGKSLSWRIERLPRGESVASVFQGWMGDGFPVHRGDIFHAINRLRKLKANKRALQVLSLTFFDSFFPLSSVHSSCLS